MANSFNASDAGLNVSGLPALTREQCLELQHSNYQAFTPTLNEVHMALRGQRISRGKDAHVYLVNGRVIGLMLRS